MLESFDVTKPPPAPPNRTIKCGIFGLWGDETKESKQISDEYLRRLEEYSKKLC